MPFKQIIRTTAVFALFLFSAVIAYSQNKTVTGKVTDSRDGSPMVGATVSAKGTRTGVQTKTDGTFSISVPSSVTTLVVSSVGFATMEIAVGSGAVNASLVATNTALNEVIVIGYGTQRRREVTGAISKVSGDRLNTIVAPSFEAALQGKAPGVQVVQGNGLAGSGSVIRIRGVGSISAGGDPLYVVDGIPIIADQFLRSNQGAMNQNPLASLNPTDIESIEILKDAGATGIYGSRGANGVILITTKRGKSGKVQFNYSTKLGAATYAKRQRFANSAEWLQLRQEAWANDGRTGIADIPGNLTYDQAAITNTDWWDLLTQVGLINEHNVSMSQGSSKLRTFANLSYANDEGYIKTNSYERISARLNMDYNLLDNLKISLTSGYNRGINKRVPSAWDGGIGDAMSSALPIFPVYISDGVYFKNGANPVRRIQETKRREINNRLLGGLSLEYQPVKNLFVRASGSIEYTTGIDDVFESADWVANPAVPDSGFAKRFPYWGSNVNGNLTVNYLKNVGSNHKFNFLLGAEAQEYVRKSYVFNEVGQFANVPYWDNKAAYKKRRDFLIDEREALGQSAEKSDEEFTFNSFFGRINYSFKEKIAVQATARVDGSSKFGTNNKHGFFPAVSAAWTLSEENFLKGISAINFLKLRGSFGIVGNANIGSGRYYENLRVGSIPYNQNPTLYYNNLGNPDLKWEKLENIDVAVEFALLNSRLTGELAYYHKITTSTILSPGISPSIGFPNIDRNLFNSKVLNEGLELSLDYKIVTKPNLRWSVGGNISRNYNEVVDWELGPDAVGGGTNDTRIVKGLPIGVNYLVRYYGVDAADGLPIWLDAEGKQTKTFSLNHRVFVGSVMPDYLGGFNSAVTYKGFDFNVLFTYVIGGKIYDNSGKYQFMGVSKKNWNFREDFYDRWTTPGDVTKYPRLTYDATTYPGVPSEDQFNSTMFLHDASYLRLRELTIGYNVPASVVTKWKMRSLKFYVSGSNLLTFTKYPGGDPEISRDFENPQDRNMSANITYLTAPTQKTFVFGINIGF